MKALPIFVERLSRGFGSGLNPVFRLFAFVLALVSLSAGAQAATLDWATRTDGTDLIATTDSATVSGVAITTHTVASGTFDSNSSTILTTAVPNSSSAGIIELAMDATTDVGTSFQTTTITFSPAVYNLSLTLRDIDGGTTYPAFNDIVDVNSNNGLPTSWDNASGVDYDSATGRASANQSTGISDETGNITVTWAGPVTSITIKHIAGPKSGSPSDPSTQIVYIDDLVFSTAAAATLKLKKISTGGTSTFSYAQTNLDSSPANITTTTAGIAAPVSPTPIAVTTLGTPITLTENATTGYALTAASCTDGNSANTGNTGTFGTLAGNVLTIPAANVVAGADFTCTFTNARATVSVQKLSLGNTGTFSFTDTNVSGTFPNVMTGAVNTLMPVPPVPRNVNNPLNQVTLNEVLAAGFTFTTVTCTDTRSAITGNAPVTSTTLPVTIPASGIQAGGAYNCIFTNTKTPTVKFRKQSIGGTASFSFNTPINLASAPVAINTATSNPGPAAPAAINITTLGSQVQLTEGAVAGYAMTGFSCVDANSANTGNAGSFGTFNATTRVVTIPAANVVAGADLTCTITNTRATVSVQKQTLGGVGGPFTITHSNLAAASTAATTSAGNNPTAAVTRNVTTIGSPVQFNESAIAPGYKFASAQCTDANSATTGNPVITSTTLPFSIPGGNVVAGSAYACVLTNARQPSLQLVKAWGANSVAGNAISIGATTGGTANTASFNSTAPTSSNSGAAVAIGVGDTITFPAESFTSGSAAAYATVLSCTADGGATANALSGTNGQVSNTLVIGAGDAGKAIVCTYTNTKLPTLQVAKAWLGPALAGATATIPATTGGTNNTAAFGPVASGTAANSGAAVYVAFGNTITFPAETFSGANAANYNSVLSCTADGGATANAVVGGNGQASSSLLIGAGDAGKAIVCTYTNTRKSTTLRLSKAWGANSIAGNVASIGATTNLVNNTTPLSSTVPTAASSTPDVAVYVGETATLPAETMSPGTVASYTTALACNAGTLSGTDGQASNTLPITAAMTATNPIICTYTNNPKAPTLSLQKALGGTGRIAAADQFSLSATGTGAPGAVTTTGALGNITSAAVSFTATHNAAYAFNEAMAAGSASLLGQYSQTVSCANSLSVANGGTDVTGLTSLPINVTPHNGDVIACTITNTPKAPTLTVTKAWGANSSAGDTASIPATTGGANNTTGFTTPGGTVASSGPVNVATANTIVFPAETFSVGNINDYATVLSCTTSNGATTNPLSGNNGQASNNLQLAAADAGKAITCTYTNNRKPKVLLTKTTVGAVAGSSNAFNFAGSVANGNGFGSDAITVVGTGSVTSSTTKTLTTAGTLTEIVETMPDSGWTATSGTCTGTAAANVTFSSATRTLSLLPAATAIGNSLDCTFTNSDVAPRLTLAKVVTNNNGGSNVAGDWTLSASGGPTALSGAGNSPAVTSRRVLAGTYTLGESATPFGYSASAWVCTGGVTVSGGNTITLANGQTTTCTITNDDIAPTVVIQKQTVGGASTPATFSFTATGLTGTINAVATTAAGTPVSATPTALTGTAGTAAQITEGAAPSGYVFVSATCVDANGASTGNATPLTFTANPFTIPAINMKPGAAYTCTISNNKLPTLQLAKTTVGAVTGVSSTFTFAAGTNANGFAGDSIAVTGSATVTDPSIHILTSASAITDIVEGLPDTGWTATSATCTGTAAGNVSFTAGTRTLTLSAAATAPGNALVCTFTNTDVAPRLTLSKTLINDNGGNAALADFTLTATGGPTTPVSGVNGATAVTSRRVLAGTYTLGETSALSFGYTPSGWNCPGETLTVNNVTLSNGEVRTCTITNNDIAPTVALRKQMVGETGTVAFTLSQTGLTGSFPAISATGAAPGTATAALPGTRATSATITETPGVAFTFSSAVCTDSNGAANGNGTGNFTYPVNGSNQFTVATTEMRLAAQIVCTLTNTKKAQITLAKTVVNDNGGSAVDTAWTLQAAGSQTISGIEGNVNVTNAYVAPGAYTLTESGGPTGYSLTGWSCPTFTLTGGSGNIITMTAGQVATCTATNDDIAARLTIVKTVTNDNGGTACAFGLHHVCRRTFGILRRWKFGGGHKCCSQCRRLYPDRDRASGLCGRCVELWCVCADWARQQCGDTCGWRNGDMFDHQQ